ncbi:hypothetical protein RZN25_04530 [Bacillaceae bacterium S4-13-56]
MNKNREIHLVKRPEAMPNMEHLQFVEQEIPTPNKGEVLLRTLYLSVDR